MHSHKTLRAIENTQSDFPSQADWRAAQRNFISFHDDEGRDGWLVVPYTFCPNVAEILDESNWAALQSMLDDADPTGETYEIQRFSPWATPYDRIVVEPNSAAHGAMAEAVCSLADYPVLHDSDFSDREYAQQHADIADGLRSLEVFQDGVDLDTDDPIATEAPRADLECMLVHQIWEHMWNDGEPWRCLEETGREGGGGVDRDDVERALTEMGYTETEHGVWATTTTDNHEDCTSCPECGADG